MSVGGGSCQTIRAPGRESAAVKMKMREAEVEKAKRTAIYAKQNAEEGAKKTDVGGS